MESIFWDEQEVILFEFLVKEHTVNSQWHTETLKKFTETVKRKRPAKIFKKSKFTVKTYHWQQLRQSAN